MRSVNDYSHLRTWTGRCISTTHHIANTVGVSLQFLIDSVSADDISPEFIKGCLIGGPVPINMTPVKANGKLCRKISHGSMPVWRNDRLINRSIDYSEADEDRFHCYLTENRIKLVFVIF